MDYDSDRTSETRQWQHSHRVTYSTVNDVTRGRQEPAQGGQRWAQEHRDFERQATFAQNSPSSDGLAISARGINSKNDSRSSTSPTRVRENSASPDKSGFIHFVAGGAAGCVSTLVTCPIDVIKTRQQSSLAFGASGSGSRAPKVNLMVGTGTRNLLPAMIRSSLRGTHNVGVSHVALPTTHSSILHHCRSIWKVEGPRSFYKGLAPSLMGVVPSRAIYFYAYSWMKDCLQRDFSMKGDSTVTHVLAAISGGFVCTSATCPLWVIKTQQQLHRRRNKVSLSALDCLKRIWRTEGWRGFYRGLSASYAGMFETVIYFAIYERLKAAYLREEQINGHCPPTMASFWELPGLMVLSSASKVTATAVAYPHEVVRTRLREEAVQKKYNGFWQTIRHVRHVEGTRALYAGLPAQLVRQVPNMAIVMGVYEAIIYASR